MTSHFSG